MKFKKFKIKNDRISVIKKMIKHLESTRASMTNSQIKLWGWANLIKSKLKKIANPQQFKYRRDEIEKKINQQKKAYKNKTPKNLG